MSKGKEVVKTEATTLAPPVHRPEWLGSTLSADIKVPRLLLMQALSEFVSDGKARPGDVVKSTTGEKVGDTKTPIKLIVLSAPQNEWLIEVNTTGKYEYKKTLPRTADNDRLPWKFTSDKDGNEVADGTKGAFAANRVRVGSFFALLPHDMDRVVTEMDRVAKGEFPDLSVQLTPVQIRCRGFSFDASLNVQKFLDSVARFRREPWEAVIELSVKHTKNEKGSFFVMDVDLSKPPTQTPQQYREPAKQAFETVRHYGGKLVVDDVEEIADTVDVVNRQF